MKAVVFVLTCLFLFSCESANQLAMREYQAKRELANQRIKTAVDTCTQRRLSGELKSRVESVRCSNPVIIEVEREMGHPYMDLVYLFTSYKLAVVERADKNEITDIEAQALIAQLTSRVTEEHRRRDMERQQQKLQTLQAMGTFMQGSAAQQQGFTLQQNQMQSLIPQPAFQMRRPITCYTHGNMTQCQ